MKKPTNIRRLRLAGPPKEGHEVTLVDSQGNHCILTILALVQEFTYSQRLWVLNEEYSKQLGSSVYIQWTLKQCKEMRSNAGLVMQIAAKYEAQLEALEKQMKQ
jgi:hypothetical protein